MNHFDKLGQAIGQIDNTVNHWIDKLGLTYNHFAVLYSLANAPDGQCTQKYIGDEWYLPKQTVFNICKEYKEKGWIIFEPSPTDKREKIMRLTADGKATAEPVLQATLAISEQAFGEFGKKKTLQLFTLMREFSEVFQKHIDHYEQHTTFSNRSDS